MKSKPAASGRMAGAAGEMSGGGNRKADAEYREGVKEFSETHDSGKIARGAAADVDEDDDEANEPPPSKDENEW